MACEKPENTGFAEESKRFTATETCTDFSTPTGYFIPTEADAEAALARMGPELRKAHEESWQQFGDLYKKLADM